MELTPTAFLVFLILSASKTAGAQTSEELFRRTLPVYGLAATSLRLFGGTNSGCAEELEILRRAIDDRILWALRMLDTSGVPKPGFVYGNNFWFGVRSQCLDLRNRNPVILNAEFMKNNSLYRDVRKEFPPFEVNYFVAYMRHNSTLQYHVMWKNEDLVTLGLCLPASCTVNELGVALKSMFQERTLAFGELYSADLQLVEVKDLRDDHRWLLSVNFIIILLAIALLALLVVAGTLYDIFHEKPNRCQANEGREEKKVKEMEVSESNGAVNSSTEDLEAKIPNESSITMKERLWGKILICFSARKNTSLIFSAKLGEHSLKPIQGLRFLGMLWILIIHPIFYIINYVDNHILMRKLAEGFAVQIISNSTFAVDTYFFMSGLLITYNFYKRSKKEKASCRENISNVFRALFHRFMRLTPAYAMALGIVQINGAWYERTSQFYMNERPQEQCAKYWWRNLLYINNLFGRDSMCMSWSWYLSADMQFFTIAISLLTLSTVYFYAAVTLLFSFMFLSIIVTGYTVYINNYIPTLDDQYRTQDELYDPPWTRIGPYLVGMITAYIIIKLNGKLSMQRKWVLVCWALSSLCNLIVLFGIYEKRISLTNSVVYTSLSRTAWGLGLAWLLIACCTNHGGIVNKILCFKTWIPLSRLTYCTYLLNPFIISSFFLQSEVPLHMDILPVVPLFLGICVLNGLAAYVLSLMVESPTVLLMRTFINVKKR